MKIFSSYAYEHITCFSSFPRITASRNARRFISASSFPHSCLRILFFLSSGPHFSLLRLYCPLETAFFLLFFEKPAYSPKLPRIFALFPLPTRSVIFPSFLFMIEKSPVSLRFSLILPLASFFLPSFCCFL